MQRAAPTVGYLDSLLLAWSQHIPWESASRIVRHLEPADDPANYVRWPEEFLRQAVAQGTGGTCFESNAALKYLLDALGIPVTYQFCDMLSSSVENPHCALIAWMEEGQHLVDAGYPIPAALPLISSIRLLL